MSYEYKSKLANHFLHVMAMSNDAYLNGHPEWPEIVRETTELMGKPEAPRSVEEILEDAALAFWVIVAEAYPQAKSGDLSPGATVYLKHAMREALVEWIQYNVPTELPNG